MSPNVVLAWVAVAGLFYNGLTGWFTTPRDKRGPDRPAD